MTATTLRGRMTKKRRHHIFIEHCTSLHVAPCCICGKPIHIDEPWRVEHIRALGLAGKDTNPNCAPAHVECAMAKDRVDMRMIRKAKRMQAAHEGRKPKSRWRPAGAVYDWRRRRYVSHAGGTSDEAFRNA